jgi:hypothetical protein
MAEDRNPNRRAITGFWFSAFFSPRCRRHRVSDAMLVAVDLGPRISVTVADASRQRRLKKITR